ncbi:DUF2911 domain-containing protein [Sphingobacterium hungaricum]
MKTTVLSLFAATALFFTCQNAMAQVKLPPASSTQTLKQGLGIKNIELTYQRPNTNGRTIFGDLVPYGEVWRTGANNIPSITFEEQVSIQGNVVPAGTYGIFTIPNKDEWTIILSTNVKQWGAYEYKKEEDFLRFNVKAETLTNKVETFTISFDDVTTKSTNVSLAWDLAKVKFTIVADQTKEILASIDEAMKGEKKPYFQAAQYYYLNDLDINKAVEWMNIADQGNTNMPYIKYWKARALLKSGNKAAAIKTAEEGVDIAKKANNGEYIKLNTQVIEQAKK